MNMVMKNARQRYPHPYYWAAFLVVGENGPLNHCHCCAGESQRGRSLRRIRQEIVAGVWSGSTVRLPCAAQASASGSGSAEPRHIEASPHRRIKNRITPP